MAVGKCINHDYRDAVSRCRQCHKPLCGECQLVTEEGIFCSKACYRKGKVFHKRATAMEARKKSGKRVPAFIGCLLKLALFVLVIVLILRFVLGIDSVDSFLDLISSLREKFLSR
jgi:hypothetical protein